MKQAAYPDFSWNRYSHAIVDELSSYGFNVEAKEKNKTKPSSIKSAFLKTNTVEALMEIGTSQENLLGIYSISVLFYGGLTGGNYREADQ